MSTRVVNWVFHESVSTGNDRLVLLAIADEADDDGSNAYPSVKRIAIKARVNERTCLRSLQRLEEVGELEVTRPDTRGRGRFNTYRVLMGKGDKVAPGPSSETVRNGDTATHEKPRNSAEDRAHECSRPIDPLTHVDPQEALGAFDADVARSPDVERLCGLLAELVERNTGKRPTITARWLQACDRLLRIDGHTPTQVENCIRWTQAHEFWAANVMSMPKLREKWPTLVMQARRANGSRPSRNDPLAASRQYASEKGLLP